MSGMHKPKKGHRYSYSGADAKVWMYRGKNIDKGFIESLQTISFSVHEPRGRARALGYRGVKGFSRSIREIAGTMIFTVIEDHPLKHLLTTGASGFSIDAGSSGIGNIMGASTDGSGRRIATNMQPFNLTMIYATEMPSATSISEIRKYNEKVVGDTKFNPTGKIKSEELRRAQDALAEAQLYEIYNEPGSMPVDPELYTRYEAAKSAPSLYESGKAIDEFNFQARLKRNKIRHFNVAGLSLTGIEIITEGIVTSVNDMITEIQVQFLAKDYKEIGLGHFEREGENANIDISYDEALGFAKNLYKENEDYMKYEEDLKKFEEKNTVAYRDYMFSNDPNLAGDLGAGYNVYDQQVPVGNNFVTDEGFYYDEATGTFTSTVITVNNPIRFTEDD